MKKIWPWLALLLLLIFLCVWTKKDSIHLTSNRASDVTSIPMVIDKTHAINYQLVQKENTYILSGNFKNTQQQNILSDTFSSAGAILGYKGTTTNDTLVGDEAIALTRQILPHFIANYSNGKIVYENEVLRVSGDVKGYEAKNIMQKMLGSTTIPTQNETNVILDNPIDFTIVKDNTLHLSGTFTDTQQIRSLSDQLRPSYTTSNVNKNAHRIDKGGITMTQKLLPHFVTHYTSGKITYQNGVLTIEGMVQTQEDLDEMKRLLMDANIPVKNLTVIDPEALKRAEEEKAAVQAEADAKNKVEQMAQALQAEQEKAKLDAQKAAAEAKAEADAAKEKIVKLLKIENIEFEVAKGTLTPKGEATVDKLANILKEYSHIKTEIAGHTDSDGSAEFNQKLSQERVDTVKKRLVSKGISASRLTAKGYGESKPLVPNTTDENKQKNRRVEINIEGE